MKGGQLAQPPDSRKGQAEMATPANKAESSRTATKGNPATPITTAPSAQKGIRNGMNAALAFEEVDGIPGFTGHNPFTAQVEEMAKTKKPARVAVPDSDINWARTQIRAAASEIGKGSVTRVKPYNFDPNRPLEQGNSWIYFEVGAKRQYSRND